MSVVELTQLDEHKKEEDISTLLWKSFFRMIVLIGQLPMRTISHQIKIKPNHCPPGPQWVGLFPTRTTPHWDHYHGITPLIWTKTCTVGNCPHIQEGVYLWQFRCLEFRHLLLIFCNFYSYDIDNETHIKTGLLVYFGIHSRGNLGLVVFRR